MATEKELNAREEEITKRERALAEKEKNGAAKTGEPCPAKYLKGLKFSGATASEVDDKKSGKKKKVFTPFDRPLKADDVLAWKDAGATVVIATADGKKHSVAKEA